MKVGTIQDIIRHPVKSFGGESLSACQVSPFGLYGDRSCAFEYVGTEKKRYAAIQDFAEMAAYRATLEDDVVTVTTPSGRVCRWDDEQLLQEIAAGLNHPLKCVEVPKDGFGMNYEDHLLITTDSSERAISAAWGKGTVDNRRYRSNLVIAMDEDQPFVEETWIGKELVIGEVVVELVAMCIRCRYLNVDPYDASIDKSVLKTVVKTSGNKFGVYASVIQPGEIRTGDVVYLREKQ